MGRLLRLPFPTLLWVLFACLPLQAAVPGLEGGHTKLRWVSSTYPDDSVFHQTMGDQAHDQAGELRLKFGARPGPFSVQVDYQLLGQFGDSLELSREFEDLFLVSRVLPTDDRRWWDLTHEISEHDSRVVVQRLDRLHVAYSGEKTVLRFGRQAVSWGNGLLYNPMDFFNPFDPAAVDTEYKMGDDMLYGQYLLDSGNDWQFVSVQRRDGQGDVSSDASSWALKLHGFGLEREYDLLLAEHFDQLVAGLGGVLNVGDSVLRGDVIVADTVEDWVTSLVANWSYSWTWGGYNVSGVAEYFFNGHGLRESNYTPQKIAAASELTARISRGELFTLGRHYLAGSMMVEVTPLVNVTPSVFLNLGDDSALLQVAAQWNLGQNWQLLAALNAPVGPDGTEYGGLESGIDGLTLAAGPSFFAQIAWYF